MKVCISQIDIGAKPGGRDIVRKLAVALACRCQCRPRSKTHGQKFGPLTTSPNARHSRALVPATQPPRVCATKDESVTGLKEVYTSLTRGGWVAGSPAMTNV